MESRPPQRPPAGHELRQSHKPTQHGKASRGVRDHEGSAWAVIMQPRRSDQRTRTNLMAAHPLLPYPKTAQSEDVGAPQYETGMRETEENVESASINLVM